jgi:hypothetical protein
MKNNKARVFGKLKGVRFNDVQYNAILQYMKDNKVSFSIAVRDLIDMGILYYLTEAAG